MALQSAPWPEAAALDASAAATWVAPGDSRHDEFDDLVQVASELFDTPLALIALIEGDNFRLAAERGVGASLVPREHAICRAINTDQRMLVLLDASLEARFRDDAMVTGEHRVRFYLGIGLFDNAGNHVGVLSVADARVRASVSEDGLASLRRLARLAESLLERRTFQRSNRIAEQIAQADFSALVVIDPAGAVTYANAAAHAMFGTAIAHGQSVHALFPASLQPDADAVGHWLGAGADDALPDSCELHVRAGDGDLRTLEAVRCAWLAGEQRAMALVLRDITDSRRLRHRRRRDAQEDPLTGLSTRASLLAALDRLRAGNTGPVGVALLGLDNFRAINDTLGHAIGDTVLQVVACRLLARLPPGAHLARFGGDEFALVFPGLTAATIEAQLRRMLRDLARPCVIDQHRVHLEASVGLAMDDPFDADAASSPGAIASDGGELDAGDGGSGSRLVARAGLAMQHAKRTSGPQLRRFEPDMRAEAIDRRELDLELRRACREGEFELHYQPQVDLITGYPTGAEALLRWRHPVRGLLAPIAFIDALARSAVAPAVGRWILQRACRDAMTWPRVNGRRLAVGVNLFPVQFDGEHFLAEVDRALESSGLAPQRLELELTELIALRDDGVAEQTLTQLRERGIRVAYDDFGTGYASLSMLHRLPVDRVKIDRSFVCNVLENRGDEAIVRSIVLIARNFDLQVIAEGVETPRQADLLRELGCHDVQGFLYSKPLAPVDFDLWLASQNAVPARVNG